MVDKMEQNELLPRNKTSVLTMSSEVMRQKVYRGEEEKEVKAGIAKGHRWKLPAPAL